MPGFRFPQQHCVEQMGLPENEPAGHEHQRGEQTANRPTRRTQATQSPESNGTQLGVGGHKRRQPNARAAESIDGNSRQQQPRQTGPSTGLRQTMHCRRRPQRAHECASGQHPCRGGPTDPASHDYRHHRAQGRSAGNAEQRGIGQRVAEHPLHGRAAKRQTASHQKRQRHARHPQQPEHTFLLRGVIHRAPRFEFRFSRFALAEELHDQLAVRIIKFRAGDAPVARRLLDGPCLGNGRLAQMQIEIRVQHIDPFALLAEGHDALHQPGVNLDHAGVAHEHHDRQTSRRGCAQQGFGAKRRQGPSKLRVRQPECLRAFHAVFPEQAEKLVRVLQRRPARAQPFGVHLGVRLTGQQRPNGGFYLQRGVLVCGAKVRRDGLKRRRVALRQEINFVHCRAVAVEKLETALRAAFFPAR
jgi:hypothetical protein